MIELPEAQTLARQLNETYAGKTITHVETMQTPHGFAFFRGDPQGYAPMLEGLKVVRAQAHGGRPELVLEGGLRLCFNDGVNMRYLAPGDKRPAKHQFYMEFDASGSEGDASCAFACTVQMYGFFGIYEPDYDIKEDFYYRVAVELPSPLTDAFDIAYFDSLRASVEDKISAKAFLATQQRIPGLGNGVLQDILWRAKIHPKRKLRTLSQGEWEGLFGSVKDTLAEMTAKGGRSTEKDLYGNPGGYPSVLSAKTLALPCPACCGAITRTAYMGGNVYFCANCQPEE